MKKDIIYLLIILGLSGLSSLVGFSVSQVLSHHLWPVDQTWSNCLHPHVGPRYPPQFY